MKNTNRFFSVLLSVCCVTTGLFSQTLHAQDLDLLRAEMTQLNNRLTRLRDHSDIEKLQRSYGYYSDKQQWLDVTNLFTDNGILEVGGRGQFLGKQRIFEYHRTGHGPIGPIAGQLNDQQQLQGIITISPDGRSAQGRWTGFVMNNNGWGDITYENDYVKENGIWKISFLHAPFNMYANYNSGWISNITPNSRPESFLPPPDLPPSTIYLTFPNYYVEPYHYVNPVTQRAMPPPDPAAGGEAFGK